MRRSIPGADDVSVTLMGAGGAHTAAFTGPRATTVDESALAVDRLSTTSGPARAWRPGTRHPRSPCPTSGFGDSASRLGISASLSISLFAGRGAAVATLNLYGRDPGALAPLTAAVRAVYDPHGAGASVRRDDLDHGGDALMAGLAGAFAVRARIQQAIGVVMAARHRGPDAAYLVLRLRAAETGATLADTATGVIAERQW